MTEEHAVTTPAPTAESTTPEKPATEEVVEPTILGQDAAETPSPKPAEPELKDGDKPGEASVVPEKYDIKMPEGMTLDIETLDAFAPLFKELKITNEGAQKLVDKWIPLIEGMAEKQRQQSLKEFKEIVDGWKVEAFKDLGAEAKSAIAASGKTLNKFGTPALRELLNETGVGNHKEMIRFMERIGKTISEDTLVEPPVKPNVSSNDPRVMYPTMTQ